MRPVTARKARFGSSASRGAASSADGRGRDDIPIMDEVTVHKLEWERAFSLSGC